MEYVSSKHVLKTKLFAVIFFFLGFNYIEAQLISVQQNLPGESQEDFVERLVRDVLIGSECISNDDIFNISSSTGLDFNGITGGNNPNGIGFFDFGNASFPCDNPSNPFQTGVLITSGNAAEVVNTSTPTLSSGGIDWLGDPQLNQKITESLPQGEDPFNSINATSIEFDFRASSENFSFSFFMASEEYNLTYECEFSDAFAFILTRPDGTSENLAIIPGTNFPITVTNVHDTDCTGTGVLPVGEMFFCGNSGANSFFVFDGYTKPFLASKSSRNA